MQITQDQDPNSRGNIVRRGFDENLDRYAFDFGPCAPGSGWAQYDTDQDAAHFGIWVHVEQRRVTTFAEGDITIIDCPTAESFAAELASMAEFYGPPPAALIVYDLDAGTRTEVIQERPQP